MNSLWHRTNGSCFSPIIEGPKYLNTNQTITKKIDKNTDWATMNSIRKLESLYVLHGIVQLVCKVSEAMYCDYRVVPSKSMTLLMNLCPIQHPNAHKVSKKRYIYTRTYIRADMVHCSHPIKQLLTQTGRIRTARRNKWFWRWPPSSCVWPADRAPSHQVHRSCSGTWLMYEWMMIEWASCIETVQTWHVSFAK